MDYEDNDNGKIADIKFSPISIGEHTCNVNRILGENLNLLLDFTDAIPHFDLENGPHLKIKNKKTNETIIVPLNWKVASGMIIPNSKNMNDEEYFRSFVDIKKQVVSDLISKTFAKGYESPSAIQALAIPELIQGKDVMAQFKSGTGKTHAFLFGCFWSFDPMDNQTQHIFITSSHEVAVQIHEQAKFLLPANTKIALCIGEKKDGGSNMSGGFKTPIGTSSLNAKPKTLREQKEEVQRAQIIICTMGKFYDFICNKQWIITDYLKSICVDEFDNIVASRSRSRASSVMSTEDQMAAIMKRIPPRTQRIFFSATVSNQALEIAHSYFRKYDPVIGEPFYVLLDIEDYTLEGIRQYYVECRSTNEKKEVLLDLLKQCRISQAIIYVNKIETASEIKDFLDDQDVQIISSIFHGNLGASERKNIHHDFCSGKVRLLISTDVTARGLDVQSINLVINFDMPEMLETYIHRVGRSGRYGKKGVAISLILNNRDKDERKKIEGINECSKQSLMEELPENLGNLL